MFRAEDREFLEAAAGNRAIRCTLAEGRRSVDVPEAAMWQMASGGTVNGLSSDPIYFQFRERHSI